MMLSLLQTERQQIRSHFLKSSKIKEVVCLCKSSRHLYFPQTYDSHCLKIKNKSN